jgi:hypothetical protein
VDKHATHVAKALLPPLLLPLLPLPPLLLLLLIPLVQVATCLIT